MMRHPIICGKRFVIHGDPGDKYLQSLPESGPFHDTVIDLLPQLLPGDDAVAVDVGANLGLHTLALAQMAHQGHVYAFEPAPGTADHLVENVKANGIDNVTVRQVGVAAEPGTLELFVNGEFAAGSLTLDSAAPVLRAHLESAHGGAETPAIVRVPRITLDTFAQEESLARLDLVKIDTEGHDIEVLRGGREVLKRFRPAVLVEFASFALTMHAQTLPADALAEIRDIFDRVFVLELDGRLREIIEPVDIWQLLSENATLRPVQDLLCLFAGHPAMAAAESLAAKEPTVPDKLEPSAHDSTAVDPFLAAEQCRRELEAMRRTLSWRVTRPLRAVRRFMARSNKFQP